MRYMIGFVQVIKSKFVIISCEMQGTPKVEYLACQRGGYHYGEVLNMVCLQKKCIQQLMCCCACIEQNHKQHNKPLRLVMLEASKAAANVKPTKFNIDIALELINSNLKDSLSHFAKFKQEITINLQTIENHIINFYSFLTEQVKIKNSDPKKEIQSAFQIIKLGNIQPKEYTQSVRKIAELIGVKSDEAELNQDDIISSLTIRNDQMRKQLLTGFEDIKKKIEEYSVKVQEIIKGASIWKQASFKFSPIFKHPDIKIIQDNIVKSTNSSGYKFAIMDPHLEIGLGIKQFGFRIKESSSNWVAVGVCHKNLVASKNYSFNFSSIGHGAYMVSANGGSWSHTKVEQNNSVKSFKFAKADVIGIKINFSEKSIVFKKNAEMYTLSFETIANDQLRPCALFYYLNDEVQFLADYKI